MLNTFIYKYDELVWIKLLVWTYNKNAEYILFINKSSNLQNYNA